MFDIDREHPRLCRRGRAMWRRYRDLYAGGEQLPAERAGLSVPRQREPGDVYAERLSRVFYRELYRVDCGLVCGDAVPPGAGADVRGAKRGGQEFFRGVGGGCGPEGDAADDFFRRQFIEGLITGASYVLVDFPRAAAKAGNRGGGRRAGGIAGVSGGLCGGRHHQLEPGRAREFRMGGDPHAS